MAQIFWFCGNLLAFALISAPLGAVEGPKIEFSELIHDFGTVHRGDVLGVEFSFSNTGDAPLAITGVHAGCGCTVADFDSTKSYRPGETASIGLTLDTKNFVGAISKAVTVITNEKILSTRTLILKAKVSEDFVLDPPMIYFGKGRATEFGERVIVLRGDSKVTPTKLVYAEDLLDARLVEGEGRWQIFLALKPTVPAGFLREQIKVLTDSPKLSEVIVPVRAEVIGSFAVNPSYLEFGAIADGAVVKRAFNIDALREFRITETRAELNINGAPRSDVSAFIEVTTGERAGAYELTIKNPATESGSAHGRVILTTNDPSQKNLVIDFYAFLGTIR
jgi:hypothetical protein